MKKRLQSLHIDARESGRVTPLSLWMKMPAANGDGGSSRLSTARSARPVP